MALNILFSVALPKNLIASLMFIAHNMFMLWCQVVQSNYIGYVLLASMYNNQTPNKNQHCLVRIWGIVMKDERKLDIKARGFHVSTKQRGFIEQQEGKECKTRRWEVENTTTIYNAKIFMRLVWKIHEIARGKGLVSWNWCQVDLEESWSNLEGLRNW